MSLKYEPSSEALHKWAALKRCGVTAGLYHKRQQCSVTALTVMFCDLKFRRAFIMNMISPQGIGAVSLISEEKAPIPYGESYP